MHTTPRQFDVYRDSDGLIRWTLYDGPRRIAVSGEGYDSLADCLASIRALIEIAPGTQINDRVTGRWHRRP